MPLPALPPLPTHHRPDRRPGRLPVTVLSGLGEAGGEDAPADDPFPAWDTYGIDDACAHEPPVPVTAAPPEA
ncbi:hypothetical protein ACWDZ4_14800 [Streptomyces sp. NPDC003016]